MVNGQDFLVLHVLIKDEAQGFSFVIQAECRKVRQGENQKKLQDMGIKKMKLNPFIIRLMYK
jgi:hypothetical protein